MLQIRNDERLNEFHDGSVDHNIKSIVDAI